jgi:hypothetical protein
VQGGGGWNGDVVVNYEVAVGLFGRKRGTVIIRMRLECRGWR